MAALEGGHYCITLMLCSPLPQISRNCQTQSWQPYFVTYLSCFFVIFFQDLILVHFFFFFRKVAIKVPLDALWIMIDVSVAPDHLNTIFLTSVHVAISLLPPEGFFLKKMEIDHYTIRSLYYYNAVNKTIALIPSFTF